MKEIKWRGYFRVYFNRAEDAPRVWSVDNGNNNLELNVKGVHIHKGVEASTDYDLNQQWPQPKAWLRGHGEVSVSARGFAQIHPLKRKKK